MNLIDGRRQIFKKIKSTLQERRKERFGESIEEESFYEECQRAALYRVYLFSVLKKEEFLIKRTENLVKRIVVGEKLEENTAEIQGLIVMAKALYGANVKEDALDYALDKGIANENVGECLLLAGERKFLYDCYKWVESNQFSEWQKDLFFTYLLIRTDFRGELIQINRKVGFSNFSNYEVRKEFFIEGVREYEDQLIRLALNEPLKKENVISLEARICPKDKTSKLYETLKRYEHIVKDGGYKKEYEKLLYVLHFPKKSDKDFVLGIPRNDNVRRESVRKAQKTVALLEKRTDLNEHIRGIDACANEMFCRPEVFGQVFRYLSDTRVLSRKKEEETMVLNEKTTNLHITYHAGEDFFDITDGLRAIDETILFCGLKRGSRLGHALALGIEPEEYYRFKGYKLLLEKQVLLDDIVWIYCRAKEMGCQIDSELESILKEIYYDLYEELYHDNTDDHSHPSMYEYYQSWKLRGDNPELYKLGNEEFERKLVITELQRFDRYQFNDKVRNEIRKNRTCRKLYYLYHFNENVRRKGKEIIEFKINHKYINLVRWLQDKMIHELVELGISIETNPSSNYLIGTIQKYEEHPIIRFNSRKLRDTLPNMSLHVSINTDDQGVFDTLLENEYALMALALKKAKDKDGHSLFDLESIYEWIDYVRRMGIEQIFN